MIIKKQELPKDVLGLTQEFYDVPQNDEII